VRRLVNDVDDRIERFQKAGWTPVEGEQVGDAHAGDPSSVGSATVKSVGAGTKALLMEIPKEYYDADQADKQTKVDELEAAMEQDIKNKLGGSAIGEGIKIKRE
jgi:S1-C subfamily serine protease